MGPSLHTIHELKDVQAHKKDSLHYKIQNYGKTTGRRTNHLMKRNRLLETSADTFCLTDHLKAYETPI